MRFEKWQALGNDYIVIEHDELPFSLTAKRVRRICEGHFGVFADGVLLLRQSDDKTFVATLAIYNPDGSRAELSGNGAREAVLYLRRRGWTDRDEFTIQTDAGPIAPTITGPESCRVDMGLATTTSKDFPGGPKDGRGEVDSSDSSWAFRHVSIGNPQCAIGMDSLAELQALDLAAIGPDIEASEIFPNRTNVSFYTEITPASASQPARVKARIFERGVGETLSSGTGATGAAIAYLLGAGAIQSSDVTARASEGSAHAVEVELDGGQLLVEVSDDLHVHLTGWARPVFYGALSDEFIKELHETK